MKLVRIKFRILIPVVYVIVGLLPVFGMIITIAEGPNPFGFLFSLWLPGIYLLGPLDRVVQIRRLNPWFLMPIILLVNAGICFLVGYLIDYFIKRRTRVTS